MPKVVHVRYLHCRIGLIRPPVRCAAAEAVKGPGCWLGGGVGWRGALAQTLPLLKLYWSHFVYNHLYLQHSSPLELHRSSLVAC